MSGWDLIPNGRVVSGALSRSGRLDALTAEGWDALLTHGIRTIVDLRSSWELGGSVVPPAGVAIVHVPLEDDLAGDPEFDAWIEQGWLSSPRYYVPFVDRWPDRVAAAVRAVADTPPGGVHVHCAGGTDRTGLVIAVILRLVGTPDTTIADDYAKSPGSDRAAFVEALTQIDVTRLGLADEEIASLRRRLDAPHW